MPKPIQEPGIARRLTYALGLLGRLRLSVADEVLPTIVTGDHSIAALPPVRRVASLAALQAAVAGELATFSFQVPPTVLAVIRRMTYVPATSQFVRMRLGATVSTAGFTQVGSRFNEGRLNGREVPASSIFTGTQVGAISGTNLQRFFSTTPDPQPMNVIVGSGDRTNFGFFEFQGSVANEAARVMLEWDEYQITVPQPNA